MLNANFCHIEDNIKSDGVGIYKSFINRNSSNDKDNNMEVITISDDDDDNYLIVINNNTTIENNHDNEGNKWSNSSDDESGSRLSMTSYYNDYGVCFKQHLFPGLIMRDNQS